MPDIAIDDLPDGAVGIARDALLEITPADTVGAPATAVDEEGNAFSVRFPCLLPGYPGWNWNVTLAAIGDGSAPSVLEVEILPGDDALLAPDWVPWSERLADYNTAQELADAEAERAESGNADSDDDDDDDDSGEDDESDDDDESDEDDLDVEDPTDLTDDLDDVLDGVDFEDDDSEDDESEGEESPGEGGR